MSKCWLLYVLLGAIAWGQAAPTTAPATPSQAPAATPATPAQAPAPPTGRPQPPTPPVDPGAAIAPTATVLTITVSAPCPGQPKAPAAKPAAASATGTKTPAAPKPSGECKTTYTKAQFEKFGNALVKQNPQAPDINPQQKKQLASALPGIMAMSQAAEAKGLDKTEHFKENLKFRRMQMLAAELQRSIQEEAAKVPDADSEKYYKDNPEAYEQFNLQRIYIPRFKQVEAKEDAKEDDAEDKQTEEQQKEKQEQERAKQAEGEQELTKLADALRARAAQGEDFVKLQKEAYDAAGMKVESPTVTMAKQRRTSLQGAQAAVFDLKVGEVSEVINDAGGHYIYKVDSKDRIPFDQAKAEIHNTLQNQRQRDLLQKVQDSVKSEPNEAYFGGPVNAGPQGRPMPPGMQQRMPPPRPPAAGRPPAPGPGAANPNPGQNPPAQPAAQPTAPDAQAAKPN